MQYKQHSNDHDYFTEEQTQNFLRRHGTGVDNVGRQRLGQIIRENKYRSVLDAPSGSAVNYEVFRNMMIKPEYVAFDLTDKLLNEAKRRYEHEIRVFKGFVQELNKHFADNSFDFVICRHIFEHLPPGDMEKVISQAFTIANKELVLVFFLHPHAGNEDIIEERSSNVQDHPEVTHFWNTYSKSKLMDFLSTLGCHIKTEGPIQTFGAAHSDLIVRLIK